MRRWWTRFVIAWRYANGLQTDSPALIAAKAELARFLSEAQTKRELIVREWASAVKRHQTLEGETKFRCDRMMAKLNKRSEEIAAERAAFEASRQL